MRAGCDCVPGGQIGSRRDRGAKLRKIEGCWHALSVLQIGNGKGTASCAARQPKLAAGRESIRMHLKSAANQINLVFGKKSCRKVA